MPELQFIRAGRLEWRDRPTPVLQDARDAIVRPIVAGRCDGDTLPIHRHVSRAMQVGMRAGLIGPVVGSICGPVPFRGPFDVSLMHMYANDVTLKVGVSNVRPVLPELLDFVAQQSFPAEQVTTLTADWEDAPEAYAAHTTKLVLHREPLHTAAPEGAER
ncbi:hypothetical protein [Nocardia sp. CA-145437]|uniref:hypothetical protein n=1 Tax=Nocardia sp. CA-145437 TaxID=3239980 RepID=UPI003D95245C